MWGCVCLILYVCVSLNVSVSLCVLSCYNVCVFFNWVFFSLCVICVCVFNCVCFSLFVLSCVCVFNCVCMCLFSYSLLRFKPARCCSVLNRPITGGLCVERLLFLVVPVVTTSNTPSHSRGVRSAGSKTIQLEIGDRIPTLPLARNTPCASN